MYIVLADTARAAWSVGILGVVLVPSALSATATDDAGAAGSV